MVNKMPNPIPLDDIFTFYMDASFETKIAVTSLLKSDMYVVSSLSKSDKENKDIKGSQYSFIYSTVDMSIVMMSTLFRIGRKEFGNIWLKILLEDIKAILKEK